MKGTLTRRSLAVAAGLLAMTILLTGCSKPAAGPENPPATTQPSGGDSAQPSGAAAQPVAPGQPGSPVGAQPEADTQFREVFSSEVEGDLWTINTGETISPDGKWVLTTQSGAFGLRMIALPLDGAAGNPRILDSVNQAWVANHYFSYHPLGWVSNTQCLFAAQGMQAEGPNKGKQGMAVFAADVFNEQPSVEQVGFIDLPQGHMSNAFLVPARKKTYFHVSRAIWEFDTGTNGFRLVKGDLPSYDGLFYPKPSPDGRYFVYNLYDQEDHGVFLLDTETGEQKPIARTGDTMSFHPFWSPDGKYIAVYTVNKKKGAKPAQPGQGVDPDTYDIVPGEDGPQPAGDAITVLDLDGRVVQTIKVEGKKLAMFKWGSGSNAIAFTAGSVAAGGGIEGFEQVLPDSVWLVPSGDALSQGATPTPLMAAAITREKPDENVFVAIAAVDRDGGGVVYNELSGDRSAVRHARLESSKAEPDKMEGSFESWMDYASNDPTVGVVGNPQGSAVYAFRPRGWSEVVRFGPDRQTLILGYNGDFLAVANISSWNPDTRPGAGPEKGIVKAFRVVR